MHGRRNTRRCGERKSVTVERHECVVEEDDSVWMEKDVTTHREEDKSA